MTVETKHHQVGSSPMEQFVQMASGVRGIAATDLIKQALEAPGLYVFSEIMDISNIKELAEGEFKSWWELLNIFAYGTFKEYAEKKGPLNLPDLSPTQARKLKYLTIVTLAEKDKCIPYTVLQAELNISEIRELEDLIIEAIYAEIIQGKLDQSQGFLEVDTTIGRDIRKDDVPTIISTLESWCDACENVLGSLQTQMDRANCEKTQKIQKKDQLDQEIAHLRKTVKAHPVDSDEIVADSREAMGFEKTPLKKPVKKGLRGSTKLSK